MHRGPAKDYLRSLQDRLQETERLLLNVLPHVPDEALEAVIQQTDTSNGPSHQAWTSSLSGTQYWQRFNLNRLDHIREWQDHRTNGSLRPTSQPSQMMPNSNTSGFSEVTRHPSAPINPEMASEHTGQNGAMARDAEPASGWSDPQTTSRRLDERRYSEETRDACEALFSISRPAEPKRPEHAPPGPTPSNPYPAASGDNSSLPSQFPKHLFW